LAHDVDVYPGATIGDDVAIGAGSTIHAGARIMAGCQIGELVTIFPNAVLYENTIVGPRSVIHAGAVLGAYGFGYVSSGGKHQLSAQLGYVEVGAEVEIGACTTIDRGTYGPTVIGEGTKIDNLVMIGHNCRIGRHNMLCSQVGIAGSTTTGDYVIMAGQAGVRDHVSIGDRAVLGAKAGVPNDVPADTMVFGIPARPEREQKLIFAAIARLPELRRQVKALVAAVARLEGRDKHEQRTAA
ncbi:MAG: UDP-3-O-(3-hydroxymyristoyl)glucosamine N-acyltransferase, partial [Pirellulales bacterium]